MLQRVYSAVPDLLWRLGALGLALVCLALSATPQSQERSPRDPVALLERWVRRFERMRSIPTPEDEVEVQKLCADVRLLVAVAPDRGSEAAQAFLAVASARPAGTAFSGDEPIRPDSGTARVRAVGSGALARLVEHDAELARWLATDVLARSGSQAPERRRAAAEALSGLYLDPTRLALFSCGLAPERALRDAALAALVGWPDDAVHRFLLDQLRRQQAEPGWISARQVRRHFGLVDIPLGSPAEGALRVHVRAALDSPDWRVAYRGLQLAPGLPDRVVVPDLIAALRTWADRREAGEGRLRLEGDITGELRRRSGRNIGPYPERWATWWASREAAQGQPSEPPDPAEVTAAGFFGLRPLTDRVVLVLDRSGSMDTAFEGGARTRYQEATEQLLALLESLGPRTRFRVILFSSEKRVWSDKLRPATPANLGLVRTWMGNNGPRGATQLQPAVAAAMRLGSRGQVDLARLEADTVIVLCDGATAEGPHWVRPLMEGPNEEACLLFHSVQIGTGGDGTLERLAEESGGDFVRVRG